eukprot:TRINITY_DN1890_c0_g1_i1.p1 TRINITY_DN1890_c0_g1~~TRINITY_DN1890_c0_g1_i1.p1  ORF type:complete len:241 (-),score=37.55 TRINITY_DN1890_c0_g1_i1:18-740(-)
MSDVFHGINKHHFWDPICIVSAIRGFRNGILTGARIRLPYVFQAVIYAVVFRQGRVLDRVKFVVKQMFIHGKNLGLFVLFYKSICCLFRNMGISNGVESWIAGFFGGYWAFGDSKGLSGSVNNQIVLYLFARGLQGALISGVKRGIIPKSFDISGGPGFRVLAGFSLALILYLTEYEPDTLSSGFVKTMDYIYHESDSGPMLHPDDQKFLPVLFVAALSLLYPLFPNLGVEQLLLPFLGK